MRTTILSLLLIATLAIASEAKQTVATKQCGQGLPSCSRNRCCNINGKCGIGRRFCKVERCQKAFGRCWNSQPPAPTPEPVDPDDSEDNRPERPENGSPAKVIYTCTVPGTVAITFDDGPAATTPNLLARLAREPDVKVTFFINGGNYVDASLPQYQSIIQQIYESGHQIASHTFQHKDLATLGADEIRDQMLQNDDIIYAATGKVPRYMRPPYGSTNAAALDTLGKLGYVVVNWDVDTKDWENLNAQASMGAYNKAFQQNARQFISLQHDTLESTANQLMDLVIPAIRSRGLKMVTVAECLGDSRPYL